MKGLCRERGRVGLVRKLEQLARRNHRTLRSAVGTAVIPRQRQQIF